MKPATRRLILGFRAMQDFCANAEGTDLRTRNSRARREWAHEMTEFRRLIGREKIVEFFHVAGNPATAFAVGISNES